MRNVWFGETVAVHLPSVRTASLWDSGPKSGGLAVTLECGASVIYVTVPPDEVKSFLSALRDFSSSEEG